jgi:acyl carrier protein
MTTTLDRLRAILIKDYKLTPDVLVPTAPLEELGIDSLGTAELLFNIEDEFGVILPPDPVQLSTLGDVVGFIDGLVAQQRAAEVRSQPTPKSPQPTA